MTMRCFVTSSMIFALTAFVQVPAAGHRLAAEPPDEYTFDPADQVVKAQLLENPEYYDAGIVATPDGCFLAWLEFVPGEGDYLRFGKRDEQGWEFEFRITHQANHRIQNPTLTVDGSGTLWLSYEAESNGQWDIFVRRWKSQGEFTLARGSPRRWARTSSMQRLPTRGAACMLPGSTSVTGSSTSRLAT